MNRNRGNILGILLAVWSLWVPRTALTAAAPREPPKEDPDLELDEVLVEGRKPVRNEQKVIDWMKRLPGRFIVDGSVTLHGSGSPDGPLQVQGRSDCAGYFANPAVRCELKIRWPEAKGPAGEALLGGVSALDPANMLYGYERDRAGVRYMLVDSNGIAESALGYLLTEDVLVSRTKCVNVPGNCERVVRITAPPDLKEVEMKIDLEVDGTKAVSFRFLMRRAPGSPR
jgi:hypothetical protein